jgi:hypothetical protein
MAQAASDVVLEQQQAYLVGGRGERFHLLEQVEAVGLLLDQPLQPSRLSLDPPQAVQQLAPILGV